MSSETEQVWARTLRKLHPIVPSEIDAASKPVPNTFSGPITIGTNSIFGPETNLLPDPGFKYLDVRALKYRVGGTFAAGEQIDVRLIVYYDDGTSASEDEFITATGDYDFGPFSNPIVYLHSDQKVIKLGFRAFSNQASTSVAVDWFVDYVQYG